MSGLVGDLGSLAIFGGMMLTVRDHAALANARGSASLGVTLMKNASGWLPNCSDAALWLEGSTGTAALREQFPLPISTVSNKPSVDTNNGQSLLKLCQNSSASLELPPVTCETGPSLHASVRFRLQDSVGGSNTGGKRFTVATVGDGGAHTRLVAVPGTAVGGVVDTFELRLVCNTDSKGLVVVASSVALGAWTTIELTSGGGRVSANGSATVGCACTSGGPVWAFLGEGFLYRQYVYSNGCVEHDLAALATQAA